MDRLAGWIDFASRLLKLFLSFKVTVGEVLTPGKRLALGKLCKRRVRSRCMQLVSTKLSPAELVGTPIDLTVWGTYCSKSTLINHFQNSTSINLLP